MSAIVGFRPLPKHTDLYIPQQAPGAFGGSVNPNKSLQIGVLRHAQGGRTTRRTERARKSVPAVQVQLILPIGGGL